MGVRGRGPRPPLGDQGGRQGPYLTLLLIVQPLGVGVRLPDQRVHQHQEGHVEQEGAHHRQVDDDDDLCAEETQLPCGLWAVWPPLLPADGQETSDVGRRRTPPSLTTPSMEGTPRGPPVLWQHQGDRR